MAEFFRFLASITVQDGVLRPATTSYWITKAELNAYIDAVDDAARAATAIGQLVEHHLDMQLGAFVKLQVSMETINDPVPDVADDVFRGNKLLFHGRAGGRGVSWTIPCRDPSAYAQLGTTLEVDLTTPVEMTDYVAAIESAVRDEFGNAVSVQSAEIVD